jgi:hypothetical protein
MATVTTNLKTQIQTRINAANSSTTKDQLLELRKAAEGLNCDESNLDTLMTAINASLNGSESNEDLIIARVASGVKPESSASAVIIKKSQEILVSGNWTVPAKLAGNTVWVTGCGAGGSGGRNNSSGSIVTGGFGGCYGLRIPVNVAPNQTISCVIGAGGAGIPSGLTVDGNSGGDTSFGSLVFKGGSGGQAAGATLGVTEISLAFKVGVFPVYFIDATVDRIIPSETINGNTAGSNFYGSVTNIATGGAAGLFGRGTDGKQQAASESAPANSGAGSGGALGTTSVVGAGGSGKIVVEWEEFL